MADLSPAQTQIQQFFTDFDKADKNSDGKLSFAEVSRIMKDNGYSVESAEAFKIFNAADKDKDFYLSRDEFGAGVKKITPTKLRECSLRKEFDSLDADKSGYISKKEIIDITKKGLLSDDFPEDKIHDLIQGVAADSNGKVSYEEFLHIMGIETAGNELKKIFKKLDVDNNGTLTSNEIFSAVAKDMDLIQYLVTIQQVVLACNVDADGKLTYEEFLAAWEKKKSK